MKNETLEAKLRNQLSPIYGLADMILLMDEKPEMKKIIIEQAKQAVNNKKIIDSLLASIEAKELTPNPIGQLPNNLILYRQAKKLDYSEFCKWLNTKLDNLR